MRSTVILGAGGRAALLVLLAGVSGCAPGTRATSTAPLDFGDAANWAALPWTSDDADLTPSSEQRDLQDQAPADTFFIHPTTYLSLFGRNATTDDEDLNRWTDVGPIRLQASVFNACCRVFAPRYRQAGIGAFVRGLDKAQGALDFAYQDVRNAFRYYLEHFNQGRPMIIASHSQGSMHAVRLLKEFFDQDPRLRKRLIAAYVVGSALPCDTYTHIPPCETPDSTGCFVNWSTFTWGTTPKQAAGQGRGCCVNPLTWRRDGKPAPRQLNLGGTPHTLDRLDPGATDAQCVDGLLWIHEPEQKGYVGLGRSMHLMDYNLFYTNIRENARYRVEAFLDHDAATAPAAPGAESAAPSRSDPSVRGGRAGFTILVVTVIGGDLFGKQSELLQGQGTDRIAAAEITPAAATLGGRLVFVDVAGEHLQQLGNLDEPRAILLAERLAQHRVLNGVAQQLRQTQRLGTGLTGQYGVSEQQAIPLALHADPGAELLLKILVDQLDGAVKVSNDNSRGGLRPPVKSPLEEAASQTQLATQLLQRP